MRSRRLSTRRHGLLAAASLALTGLGVGLPPPARAAPAQPGERVHWPEVDLLDGGRWGPADAAGHAVVVVFWSLTCPYCVRHNARLTQLQQGIGSQPLRILTAVREPDPTAVRQHMARHGHAFAVTLASGPLAQALSTRRITPLTVTVGRDGRLLQVIPGEMSLDDMHDLARLAG